MLIISYTNATYANIERLDEEEVDYVKNVHTIKWEMIYEEAISGFDLNQMLCVETETT